MRIALLLKPRAGFQYDLDWRDAFAARSDLDVSIVDNPSPGSALGRRVRNADWIVLLYSVDPAYPGGRNRLLTRLLRHRRGRLVYFPRNEYKNFRQKREFIRTVGANLVVSQLPPPSSGYLYGDLCRVLMLPHATNPDVYRPTRDWRQRPVVIGSRTAVYPAILLDDERNRLAQMVERIRALRPGWEIDYSDRPEDRFDRQGWARFLNRCRFTLASEAGAPYVDRSDAIHMAVERRLQQDPGASLAELRQEHTERLAELPSGKHITSRHFEAMGCGTCQILLRGAYNGILEPDVHYLPIAPDGADLYTALEKMADVTYVSGLVQRSYDLVRSGHRHQHRLEQLVSVLRDL